MPPLSGRKRAKLLLSRQIGTADGGSNLRVHKASVLLLPHIASRVQGIPSV